MVAFQLCLLQHSTPLQLLTACLCNARPQAISSSLTGNIGITCSVPWILVTLRTSLCSVPLSGLPRSLHEGLWRRKLTSANLVAVAVVLDNPVVESFNEEIA